MSIEHLDRVMARAQTPAMSVTNLHKTYGSGESARPVLADVSFTTDRGSFVCIVGPSGAGKTTLLRCLAGLIPPTSGAVRVGDAVVDGPPREVAVVFQDYSRSLLPWMRALANVAFPLQGKGVGRKERTRLAYEALERVGLAGSVNQYPWQLSGGMQQRVAIARAIAYEPEILLMDEPFASVDAQTRFELEDLMLHLRRTLGITVVLVTHDIDEAIYLGDEVYILSGAPSSVIDVVPIGFGADRDQITTRADAAFGDLRSRVLRQLRAPQPESIDATAQQPR